MENVELGKEDALLFVEALEGKSSKPATSKFKQAVERYKKNVKHVDTNEN